MRYLLAVLLVLMLLVTLAPPVAHAEVLVDGNAEEGTGVEEGGSVGAVLGTLGLYAAMMAVLAVGAEVIIDAVRPIFGLKRKTTATEALSDLRDWLPGALEDMGANSKAQQQVGERLEELERITLQFEDKAERVRHAVRDELSNTLKSLAIYSAEEALERSWRRLKPKLKKIDPDLNTEELRDWLEAALTRLKEEDASNIAEVNTYLHSVSMLFDAVREENYNLQGPLRKFWRWLCDNMLSIAHIIQGIGWLPAWLRTPIALIFRVPALLQYLWAWLKGKLPEGETLRERLENLGRHKSFDPVLTMEEAARRILEEKTHHKDQENNRIAWLRILSVIVGILLAAMLKIDAIQLLEPILGNAAVAFRDMSEAGQAVEWYTIGDLMGWHVQTPAGVLGKILSLLLRLKPGIALSGLGAAAGSGFWHDQLDKLRNAKDTVGQIEEISKQIKEMTG